ncbi:hypothetical protein WA016_06190 [Myxococcus stipitatus]
MLGLLVGMRTLYSSLGRLSEGLGLLGAIAPLLRLDVFLHHRTQVSTEGLRSCLAASAWVLREGHEEGVSAMGGVVGDRVRVEAGSYCPLPVDGLIVRGEGLQVEASSLTREALPVGNRPLSHLPPGEAPPVAGRHWGMTVAAALCVVLAVVRWRQGGGWTDAPLSAATLGVAVLPEAFPLALILFLGASVYRVARRQALVRRAVSVESAVRVSVPVHLGRVVATRQRETAVVEDGKGRLLTAVKSAPERGPAPSLTSSVRSTWR